VIVLLWRYAITIWRLIFSLVGLNQVLTARFPVVVAVISERGLIGGLHGWVQELSLFVELWSWDIVLHVVVLVPCLMAVGLQRWRVLGSVCWWHIWLLELLLLLVVIHLLLAGLVVSEGAL